MTEKAAADRPHQEPGDPAEILITRLPGRPDDVCFRISNERPNTLIVIGFKGLPHGDAFGFDQVNREKMRAWLSGQESKTDLSLSRLAVTLARAINNATLPELRDARGALTAIGVDITEAASLRLIAKAVRNAIKIE